jgi:alcohol dehydrogenase class IV
MLDYSFFAPRQIVFGWGRRAELGTHAAKLGRRALLVSGSRTLESNGTIEELTAQLRAVGLEVLLFSAPSREPEVRDVDQLTAEFRAVSEGRDDVVIAVGGGATIDLAKAAAALATNRHGGSVVDFLEGVGSGQQITERPLPVIAMPTTSGTGAEATKNSVISSNNPIDQGKPFKKSLRSELMVPTLVLIDPELTVSLPAGVTAVTGMDAITQLIESYVSRRAAPIPQALCLHGLKLAIPALPIAVKEGSSRMAREAMAHAALLSGIALANSGLGFAHGVAAALGVTCQIPHGLACAVLLPAALHVNLPVCTRQFAELERLFDPEAEHHTVAANAFIDRIEALCEQLEVPSRLRDLGVQQSQLADLVTGSRGNSMSGNPRELSDAKLTQILNELW